MKMVTLPFESRPMHSMNSTPFIRSFPLLSFKTVAFVFLVLLLPFTGISQVRKYSNEFLNIGAGARGLAMSNSLSALSNDAMSVYWNPAATPFINADRQLGLMHASYFGGIGNYDVASLTFRSQDQRSALSIAYIRLGVDDIPNTLELIDADGNIRYDLIRSFSATDQAFFVSYGKKLAREGLSLGGNVKVIRRQAGDFASAWGFGLDLGLRWETGIWHFALVGKDITGTFNAWSFNTTSLAETFLITGNVIPENSVEVTTPSIVLGSAVTFPFGEKSGLSIECDLKAFTDGKRNVLIPGDPISLSAQAGLEMDIAGVVFLRGGAGNFQRYGDENGKEVMSFMPTLGMGLNISNFATVDYAFTDPGNQSIALYSHMVSLTIHIHSKLKF